MKMNKEIQQIVRLESKTGNPAILQAWAGKCSVSMLKVIEDCIPPEVFMTIKKAVEKKKAEFEAEKTPETIINQAVDLGLKYALITGFLD